jgi:hypothetical protein
MTNSHSTTTHHEPTEQMAEPDAVDIKSIAGYAIGLAVVTVVSHLAMVLTFNSLAASTDAANPPRVYPLAVNQDSQRPPEPRLQGGAPSFSGQLVYKPAEHNPGPKEALQELRAEEDVILQGYSWVDRNAKVVHIPIAEAMKLALQRGLPARDAAATQTPQTPEQGKERGK